MECPNCETLKKEIEDYKYRLKCQHDLRIEEITRMKLEFIERNPPQELVGALHGLNNVWNYLMQIDMPKLSFTDEEKNAIEESGVLKNHPMFPEEELRDMLFEQLGKDKWWLDNKQYLLRKLQQSRDEHIPR